MHLYEQKENKGKWEKQEENFMGHETETELKLDSANLMPIFILKDKQKNTFCMFYKKICDVSLN